MISVSLRTSDSDLCKKGPKMDEKRAELPAAPSVEPEHGNRPPADAAEQTVKAPGCHPEQEMSQAAGQQPPSVDPEAERMALGLWVTLDFMSGRARQTGTVGVMSRFHCVREPQLPLKAYLARLRNFFYCSTECYVLCMVYIDRLIQRHPKIVVGPLSCHRLLITSLTVAAKFLDDTFYSNAYYAKVGGLRVAELNGLEQTFLRLLDWRLHIRPEEFETYARSMKEAASRYMVAPSDSDGRQRAHLAGA